MKRIVLLLVLALTCVLSGCGPSSTDQTVSAREAAAGKSITRWRWEPNSAVATPKGVIIEHNGSSVEATFVYLKDGPGFVVDKTISKGRYFAPEQKIVFPPAMMTSEELDMAIKMDVGRVEVTFPAEGTILKGRWTGQGVPAMTIDFLRVQE